ncbi:hypothetical protein AB0O34_21455 [Sphaerisporangium sp. NPDC088356]|uniref:hypothetical protein n=1 Tax=Sphaerisporangium sp. NPDC088356 TaxID=3154871 RepID=UPI0034125170
MDYLKRTPTEIKERRFAIIVDEARSSQSGDAATALRDALRDLGLDQTVLDLRRDIGSLFAAEGQVEDAEAVLQPLHEDLAVLYGLQHHRTWEVRDLLARLRLSGS